LLYINKRKSMCSHMQVYIGVSVQQYKKAPACMVIERSLAGCRGQCIRRKQWPPLMSTICAWAWSTCLVLRPFSLYWILTQSSTFTSPLPRLEGPPTLYPAVCKNFWHKQMNDMKWLRWQKLTACCNKLLNKIIRSRF
jgi:hypothetical protein